MPKENTFNIDENILIKIKNEKMFEARTMFSNEFFYLYDLDQFLDCPYFVYHQQDERKP